MIVVWLLNLASSIGNWFADRLGSLPTITFPSSVSLSLPVPGVSSGFVVQLNAWAVLALIVFAALASARLVLWLYRLIPFNG